MHRGRRAHRHGRRHAGAGSRASGGSLRLRLRASRPSTGGRARACPSWGPLRSSGRAARRWTEPKPPSPCSRPGRKPRRCRRAEAASCRCGCVRSDTSMSKQMSFVKMKDSRCCDRPVADCRHAASSGPPGGVAGCRPSDLEVRHGGQPLAGDPRGASRAGRRPGRAGARAVMAANPLPARRAGPRSPTRRRGADARVVVANAR